MKRKVLNLFALTLILGGAAHLNAQSDTVRLGEHCCSGGANKCCGANGCESGASGCSAW
jgi:hypothetical protein